MTKPAIVRKAVLGLDVGKSSHWACLVTAEGEVAANRPVANSEEELDGLFAQVEGGTLVVVDQVRNIGALAIRRARRAGLEVAYLPGIAAHGAARLFAGDAKTDERDAMVIAKTALGIPDALLPAPRENAELEAARSMAAQRDHMVTCATRDKNRLRSILLESCPPFEALADLNTYGYFDSDESCVTKTPGIFVAGDCRSKRIRQITTASADGAVAALAACAYIDNNK